MSLKSEVILLEVVAVGSLFSETILAFTATRVCEDDMISRRCIGDLGANFNYDSSA
jgi:hypothetical protein